MGPLTGENRFLLSVVSMAMGVPQKIAGWFHGKSPNLIAGWWLGVPRHDLLETTICTHINTGWLIGEVLDVALAKAFGAWLLWWLACVQEQLKRKLEIYTFCITQNLGLGGFPPNHQWMVETCWTTCWIMGWLAPINWCRISQSWRHGRKPAEMGIFQCVAYTEYKTNIQQQCNGLVLQTWEWPPNLCLFKIGETDEASELWVPQFETLIWA